MRALLWWAVSHKYYTLQREHVGVSVTPGHPMGTSRHPGTRLGLSLGVLLVASRAPSGGVLRGPMGDIYGPPRGPHDFHNYIRAILARFSKPGATTPRHTEHTEDTYPLPFFSWLLQFLRHKLFTQSIVVVHSSPITRRDRHLLDEQ